jgi:curved DNA-binding protein CbpA
MKTHYEILGVSRNAAIEEIRKAYRELAKILHPDNHNNSKSAEEQFKLINESYKILSDENRRRQYDDKIEIDQNKSFSAATIHDNSTINIFGYRISWGDLKVAGLILFVFAFLFCISFWNSSGQ